MGFMSCGVLDGRLGLVGLVIQHLYFFSLYVYIIIYLDLRCIFVHTFLSDMCIPIVSLALFFRCPLL
jgi:hypothetical protein